MRAIIVSGTAEEIASLVLALQERREPMIRITSKPDTAEDRQTLADTLRSILVSQIQARDSTPRPDPTSPEHSQGGESRPVEPDP